MRSSSVSILTCRNQPNLRCRRRRPAAYAASKSRFPAAIRAVRSSFSRRCRGLIGFSSLPALAACTSFTIVLYCGPSPARGSKRRVQSRNIAMRWREPALPPKPRLVCPGSASCASRACATCPSFAPFSPICCSTPPGAGSCTTLPARRIAGGIACVLWGRPVPPLAAGENSVELPFWVIRPGQPRRRLFVGPPRRCRRDSRGRRADRHHVMRRPAAGGYARRSLADRTRWLVRTAAGFGTLRFRAPLSDRPVHPRDRRGQV